MSKKSTVFDLDKSKLSRLLKIGLKSRSAEQSVSTQHTKAGLWAERLSKPLPLETPELQALSVVLTDFCQRLGLLSQETIGVLLKNPDTELAVIKVIKKYAKQFSGKSHSKDECMIAKTLYYAAIAHALVYHKKRITSFGYQDLTLKFQRLSKSAWLDTYSLGLFGKALKRCRTKRSSS